MSPAPRRGLGGSGRARSRLWTLAAPPISDRLYGYAARYQAEPERRALDDIFAEEPVALTEFVQGRRYLNNPPLSPVQYDAVLHAERVYYPDLYPLLAQDASGPDAREYWSAPVRPVNFLDLLWGKGSGKDHVARMISLRIAYLLLCLRNPQTYYGIPEQDYIHLLNVASSAPQANRAFFQPMARAVGKGWFADFAEPKTGEIEYAKQIKAISGHSDAETQEGLNLILGVADEIDAFPSAETARKAGAKEPVNTVEGIIKLLRSSATTRFPGRTEDEPPVFKNVRISYPRYVGSPIERLVAQGARDIERKGLTGPQASRRYVSGPLATWQVNPRVRGKEAFADDYDEDPVMARAKYECKPAKAVSPYFRNEAVVQACFGPAGSFPRTSGPEEPKVPWLGLQGLRVAEYQLEQSQAAVPGRPSTPVWVPVYDYAPHFQPRQGALYVMHADLSLTGDAAGIAMAHVSSYQEVEVSAEGENGGWQVLTELRPVVTVDFVQSWTADNSLHTDDQGAELPAREIQVRWARNLCFELIRRGFNIVRFTFDNFQSADNMQILNSRGVESLRVSADRVNSGRSAQGSRGAAGSRASAATAVSGDAAEVWKNLRDLLYEGRLRAPHDPETVDEILSLDHLPNGKIDHPPGGKKDRADALACAAFGAVLVGGEESGDRSYFSDQGPELGYLAPARFDGSAPDLVGAKGGPSLHELGDYPLPGFAYSHFSSGGELGLPDADAWGMAPHHSDLLPTLDLGVFGPDA